MVRRLKCLLGTTSLLVLCPHDASWGTAPRKRNQGGLLVFITPEGPTTEEHLQGTGPSGWASVVLSHWRSMRLRRVRQSCSSAEAVIGPHGLDAVANHGARMLEVDPDQPLATIAIATFRLWCPVPGGFEVSLGHSGCSGTPRSGRFLVDSGLEHMCRRTDQALGTEGYS